MHSVASAGTADRITARTFFKVLRPGSGTPARYWSTFFGAPWPFAAELRLPDFTFFMRGCYKNFHFKSMFQTTVQPLVSMLCADVTLGRSRLSFRILRLWTAG